MTDLPFLISFALVALCLAIIFVDLRHMRIPDWISVAVVGLFVCWAVVGYPDVPVLARLAVAGVVFAICFALFAARVMGGGDTKVIPVLSLFVPLSHMPDILLLFAACLMGSIGVVLLLRKFFGTGASGWAVLSGRKLPMGVAIGTTGVIVLVTGLVT